MHNKLSARGVAAHLNREAKKAAAYSDGGGLYLRVRPNRGPSWFFVSSVGGKRREIGLGPAIDVSLSNARQRAAELRQAIIEGHDPFAERAATKVASRKQRFENFGEFADALVDELSAGWTNPVHLRQWRETFRTKASMLRHLELQDVTTDAVLDVLRPLWISQNETASRVRGRIERVLDAARARGLIASPWENPARWRGHLAHLLPPRRKLTARGHQAAMPFEEIPQFIYKLRQRSALAARALELTILCATRTNETLKAKRKEFDLERRAWIVPAERTKMRREHRIPLSDRAVEILAPLCKQLESDDYVFAVSDGNPLSQMSMMMLLRRMGYGDYTVHGTARSSFRDWAGECTTHAESVAEAALAHSAGDATVRAYRRGDAFEKRRSLMADWAAYCASASVGSLPTGDRAEPEAPAAT